MFCIDFSRLRFLVNDNAPMRHILHTLLSGFHSREVHEAEDVIPQPPLAAVASDRN